MISDVPDIKIIQRTEEIPYKLKERAGIFVKMKTQQAAYIQHLTITLLVAFRDFKKKHSDASSDSSYLFSSAPKKPSI